MLTNRDKWSAVCRFRTRLSVHAYMVNIVNREIRKTAASPHSRANSVASPNLWIPCSRWLWHLKGPFWFDHQSHMGTGRISVNLDNSFDVKHMMIWVLCDTWTWPMQAARAPCHLDFALGIKRLIRHLIQCLDWRKTHHSFQNFSGHTVTASSAYVLDAFCGPGLRGTPSCEWITKHCG